MNYKEEQDTGDERPLALLIRSQRQWHGDQPLTQKELAERAGISVRQLKHYETRRDLPRAVEAMLCIAEALEVTIDELITPWLKASATGHVVRDNE